MWHAWCRSFCLTLYQLLQLSFLLLKHARFWRPVMSSLHKLGPLIVLYYHSFAIYNDICLLSNHFSGPLQHRGYKSELCVDEWPELKLRVVHILSLEPSMQYLSLWPWILTENSAYSSLSNVLALLKIILLSLCKLQLLSEPSLVVPCTYFVLAPFS